jgi:hypothetical protein
MGLKMVQWLRGGKLYHYRRFDGISGRRSKPMATAAKIAAGFFAESSRILGRWQKSLFWARPER